MNVVCKFNIDTITFNFDIIQIPITITRKFNLDPI